MINRLNVIFSFLSILSIVGCSSVLKKLAQEDIDKHITAYEKMADSRERLELELKKSNSISIYTCKECQPILDSIAIEAGYSNFESFLIMDLRIMYTMRYVAYLKITEIVGEVAKDIPEDNLCSRADKNENLDKEEKARVEKYCQQMAVFQKYISKLSITLKGLAAYVLKLDDIEIVNRNYDDLHSVMTNPDLIDDLNRSGDGGWDD